MNAPVQNSKAAQGELVQLENRLEEARKEYADYKRQIEQCNSEIIAKKTDFAAYITDRERQIRQIADQNSADKKMLDAKREEFRIELDKHIKEKTALAQEKVDFAREKSRVDGRHRLINDFIAAVRRAYNVLPDA